MKDLIGSLIRFLISGGVVYVVDWSVFYLLFYFAADLYVLAVVLGRVAGLVAGMVLHRQFSFPGRFRNSVRMQALLMLSLFAVNVVISALLIWFLHEMLGIGELWSKLATDVVVVLNSFLLSKFVVFRHEAY